MQLLELGKPGVELEKPLTKSASQNIDMSAEISIMEPRLPAEQLPGQRYARFRGICEWRAIAAKGPLPAA